MLRVESAEENIRPQSREKTGEKRLAPDRGGALRRPVTLPKKPATGREENRVAECDPAPEEGGAYRWPSSDGSLLKLSSGKDVFQQASPLGRPVRDPQTRVPRDGSGEEGPARGGDQLL